MIKNKFVYGVYHKDYDSNDNVYYALAFVCDSEKTAKQKLNEEFFPDAYMIERDCFYYEENNVLNEIKQKIDWLESHNKNYTKQQYNLICDIKDLLN